MRLARAGLFALLLAFTAAASYVGSRAGGPLGAVLGAVFGLTISTLAEAGRRRIEKAAELRQKRPQVFIGWQETRPRHPKFPPKAEKPARPLPPADRLSGAGQSPATMLLPEHPAVPFIGRERELAKPTGWCTGRTGPLLLLTGDGGTGKTRLALELAARLDGWRCGWVRPGQEAGAIDVLPGGKSLIVVDYAETRDRKNLAELVGALAWPKGKRQVRVLLIARAAGDWWRELPANVPTVAERKVIQDGPRTRLRELARNEADWGRQYAEAVQVFRERLEAAEPAERLPDLGPSTPVLVIHVAALLAVLESHGGRLSGQDEVMTRLLEHEDRYWQRCAQSCQLADMSPTVRRQSVALLCLTGADDPAHLAGLLRRVPLLADASGERRHAIVSWLQMLYPGQQERQIGGLQPNLLAEHLVVRELAADPAFRRALIQLPYPAARHAMTVLARATRHSGQAGAILQEALAADMAGLAGPAIIAARETDGTLGDVLADVVEAKPMSATQLLTISAAIPPDSQALRRAAVSVGNKLLDGESERRRLTNSDGGRADVDLRRREDDVAVAEKMAQLFRDRAEADPDVWGRDLVRALELLRGALADHGRDGEAAKVAVEIAQIDAAGAA